MKYLCFAFFILLALPVQASDLLCQKLIKHVPDSNVAYQAGVDVHGKAVVPADVEPQAVIPVPDVIEIPLTVDLAQRLQLPVPQGVQMEALVGFLQITKDGKVLQNGRDLTDQAVYLCKDSAKTGISKEYTHEPARTEARPEAAHSH